MLGIPMPTKFSRVLFASNSALVSLFAAGGCFAQETLPPIEVVAPSPIVRRPAAPRPGPTVPGPAPVAQPAAPTTPPPGTLPIVTDQFATVTVVPNEEIRRNGATTMGDLLFGKPGITGSSFAPGASSRPIIRVLDVNRDGIVENGIAANGASALGEDHFVPVDPLSTNQIEVIRGPATLRYGSQAIGGGGFSSNSRIPEAVPPCHPGTTSKDGCFAAEVRGNASWADTGVNGGILLDAGKDNVALHFDAFGRVADDYRIPHYPYLVPPNPLDAPRASQPGQFNGRQPNSSLTTNGWSLGGSYLFDGGYAGIAIEQNNALYHIPGIDGEDHNTRIDAHQTKILTKGEWRSPTDYIDVVRFWGGLTDYKHTEIGLLDDTDPSTDGPRQIFTNKEQEGRVEVTLKPFDLRFAQMTTAIGVQGGHQELTAPSPDDPTFGRGGLWDPNSNRRIATYIFNEFKFSETTKAQIAGRIERVDLSGSARIFTGGGLTTSTPVSPGYTPKSGSIGLIQNFAWGPGGSLTAQPVERAPKPAELFSGGGHDATATFDIGNPNLKTEIANSIEVGLRRATGQFRFEATAYYTRFTGFIFRRLTGETCDDTIDTCTGPLGAPGATDRK